MLTWRPGQVPLWAILFGFPEFPSHPPEVSFECSIRHFLLLNLAVQFKNHPLHESLLEGAALQGRVRGSLCLEQEALLVGRQGNRRG